MSGVTDQKLFDYLKKVTAELHQARQRLAELDTGDEPIAVVGMACRFPGGVGTPEQLWDLVARGADAVTGFPTDRGWDLDGLLAEGGSVTEHGGFLDGVADFDPEFFGISPREALAMDPQQRLLLETSWEALEHAGLDPAGLTGTDVGVFTGTFPSGYLDLAAGSGEDLAGHLITGGSQSVASGRVSYVLGLQGPAMTVDTACSSSLVALHLAVQALRAGECSMALAGGVTVMATPDTFVGFSRQGGMAADGRCKAFADGADGTGWSEGVGILVVQRLSDAVREGRQVLAVVRGSAVNQDGASNGLTAPNGPAQQKVIRQALAVAGLAPSEVDAVEAHGTGTVLGDPIEAQALIATYGQDRDTPLLLGSLKSNLGHSQAAAGVAGVIKMIMALRHGVLPSTLHVDAPSSRIDWTAGSVRLLTEATPWPETGRPRRAAVSSFGVSGTNAHVILEAAPARAEVEDPAVEVLPWVLSGRTGQALRDQAARLLADLPADSAAVGRTLLARTAFAHRAVVIGADRDELVAGLRAVADDVPAPGVVLGEAGPVSGLVFVFPGQGAQWAGMAVELLAESAVFAAALDECAAALKSFVDWDLREVLADEESLARVDVVQPALWAVMVSLAALWRSLGVEPDAVLGHSQGEIAAVCVAGGLSLVDGARVVALRSRAIADTLAGQGGMAAVPLPVAAAIELIRDWQGRLAVAAVNGPNSVVVSGDPDAIAELVARCEAEEVRAKVIPVDYASHSAQVERIAERLLAELAPISPRPATVPVYSTVTGAAFDTAGADAAYWVRNLRETVRFERATRTAIADGLNTFVEVSPHPVLTTAVQDTAPEAIAVGALRRGAGGRRQMLTALAELFARGGTVDWAAALPGSTRVDLPAYAFQHSRFWPAALPLTADVAAAGLEPAGHPLLGAVVSLADPGTLVLTGRLGATAHPWLADHRVRGRIVFPGTGFAELAIRAGDAVGCARVAELVLETPLVLTERGCQVRVSLTEQAHSWVLAVHARPEGTTAWTRHATGLLTTDVSAAPDTTWAPEGPEADLGGLYAPDGPIAYGPAFQGLRRARVAGDRVWAEVELPEVPSTGYGIHPALFDAVLHAAGFTGLAEHGPALPFLLADVVLHATGATRLRALLTRTGPDSVSLTCTDHAGAPVLTVGTLTLRPLPEGDLVEGPGDTAVLVPQWIELSEGTLPDTAGWAVIEPGTEPPADAEVVVLSLPHQETPDPVAVHQRTEWVLDRLQRLAGTRLIVHTRGAVAATDLAAAAVWGLVRAAQSENPGLITLVDTESDANTDLLARAVSTGETQVAVRGDRLLGLRLVRATNAGSPPVVDGPVLVTGGTGGLGGLLAKHLVTAYGVRELVLLSRSGGGAELVAELAELGATATVVAGDVADRDTVAALFAAHPVRGVVHAAGVLDDGLTGNLTAEQLHTVLAPKVDGLWHLHELAGDLPLFAVFSSLAGILGNAGQGNYAAANTYADALIQWRRDQGLAGISLAWGAWTPEVGRTGALAETDRRRLERSPLPPLSIAQGLALFDTALATNAPVTGLTRLAPGAGELPVLRALFPATAARPVADQGATGEGFAQRWRDTPAEDRPRLLRDLVGGHVAAVLGHNSPAAVSATRPFKELGFDSLTAVELRNRIAAASGLRLPATLVFDHPSVTAVADHLTGLLGGASTSTRTTQSAVVAEDPIAIVGMACRLPGGVGTPDELWELLAEGRDAISGFPADRGWDLDALSSGDSVTTEGGFLTDAAGFDAAFFGISPREAVATDPQQRLLLETSWEALEHAGIDPSSLAGEPVGVFAGAMPSGYIAAAGDSAEVAGHMITGGSQSVISGRIAYTLGLQGPAVTVDTACSSSLVALHWAAQALRSGECGMALVGGVSVLATPDAFIGFSLQGGLSTDGRCKPYAEAADGTGWAEGVGVLVVQRLSDARREGRRVLAVVRGSAVNQDGASNGLTAPNGPAQQRVIQQALAAAGLTPSEVDTVEGHGTGTVLGDPIEAQAVLATYGQDRETPLYLGSLKSNLGHTQAAAGVAGIIKMVQAMRHGTLPQSLHIDAPSSTVDWSAGSVELLTEARPWPETGRPRRAGVSSFGVSGTNAHVILEAAEPLPPKETPAADLLPWVLSASSAAALREQAERIADTAGSAADIAWTLATARARLAHRLVVTGTDRAELAAALRAFTAADPAAEAVHGQADTDRGPVLVFPGQGGQWAGMALDLLDHPVFAEALAECTRALAPYQDWTPAEVLGDEVALAKVEVVQPLLWAIMVSLAAVWRSLGVRPAAVIGHSQGEIAALCVAGGLSLEDGARIVSLRAKAIAAELAGSGGMAAVRLPAEQVAGLLGEGLSIAAINSPTSVVVSGEIHAVRALVDRCVADGVRATLLPIDYAAHAAPVDRIADRMLADLAGIQPRPAPIPVYSSVTGEVLDTSSADAAYWVRNTRHTVRFADAVHTAAEAGHQVFLEVGPHPVLTAAIQETRPEAGAVGTLRRDEPGPRRLLDSAARLFVSGVPVDWRPLLPAANLVDLPVYPFQHQRYWPAAPANTGDVTGAGLAPADHPLLGALVALPDSGAPLFTGRLSLATHPWLAQHTVRGSVLLPGAALVELAVRAGDAVGCTRLAELVLEAPLVLPARGGVQLRVSLAERDGGWAVTVHARAEHADWTRHATGLLTTGGPTPIGPWTPEGTRVDTAGLYGQDGEVRYGPAFQGLTEVWAQDGRVWAAAELPGLPATGYGIHPALLDAVLQTAAFAIGDGGTRLPFTFTDVVLHASGATRVRIALTTTGDQVTLAVTDPTGAPVLTIGGMTTRPLPDGALTDDTTVLTPTWRALGELAPGEVDGWLIAEDPATAEGNPTHLVMPVPRADDESIVDRTHRLTALVLDRLQRWLADPRADTTHLVVVTAGATDTDPAAAAIWGLVHTAQNEHPDRITLIDLDPTAELDLAQLAAAVATGEPRIAVREGIARAPELWQPDTDTLIPPPANHWRLETTERGTLAGLALVACPEQAEPLPAGHVRLAVRAAGLNFRDVLSALDMYPGDPGPLGGEAAGVITEVGPDVTGLAVGDKVLAMAPAAFGTTVVADQRLVARIPDGWAFAEAASIPIAFLTAYYGLVDLARVRRGEKLLVHAGTGGVGMAAIQLARHFGLEVFATASESKWDTLRSLGLDDDHIASSRSLEFADRFRDIDVVLNSLAGEYIDASLGLLTEGGRFLEMGKTDLREGIPGYQAFDMVEAGPERIGAMLTGLMALFAEGALRPLPVTSADVRAARSVFRTMSQARHTGKLVLTLPEPVDPDGTVVITGGTGGLGSAVARHLVRTHGARRLLLLSRRGTAPELVEELTGLGAEVTVTACDAADRTALAAALAGHRVTGVVHAAGVLDDGVLSALTPERVDRVFAPKVDATWHLHELLGDTAFFVVFSSLAGLLGNPGQGNYAAANTFADAVIRLRRAQGRSGTSMAWGSWTAQVGLTSTLTAADRGRMAAAGMLPLSVEQGLALFDTALRADRPLLGLTRFTARRDRPASASRPVAGAAPADQDAFTARLAALPAAERPAFLLDLVRGQAAAVLGHPDPGAVEGGQAFRDLGFDSLTAVELRNRLSAATGLTLPATLVFDHPTPHRVVALLRDRIEVDEPSPAEPVLAYLTGLKATVDAVGATERDRIAERLRELLDLCAAPAPEAEDLDEASDDELFALVDQGID
ncbi:type I polyketide synthase [Crossiella cryophila]